MSQVLLGLQDRQCNVGTEHVSSVDDCDEGETTVVTAFDKELVTKMAFQACQS